MAKKAADIPELVRVGFSKIYFGFFFMGKSEEIQYLFSRNFAQIQVLRGNARKLVRAKISTNKVSTIFYYFIYFHVQYDIQNVCRLSRSRHPRLPPTRVCVLWVLKTKSWFLTMFFKLLSPLKITSRSKPSKCSTSYFFQCSMILIAPRGLLRFPSKWIDTICNKCQNYETTTKSTIPLISIILRGFTSLFENIQEKWKMLFSDIA